MPLIAIAPCSKLPDYEESVRRAGGDVRVLTPTDSAADVIASVQGLLLTGGGDVQPSI
jgi:gamma-glutamyl-gamma-aminobutyrate hydrolase PuuD